MVKGLEEIIEFILIGAFDEVHQEENDVMERQETVTDEIFVGLFA